MTVQIPNQIKTIKSEFNYNQIWCFLHDKGTELFGDSFELHATDTEVIIKLIAWFIRDTEQAQKSTIDLKKGILLVGPVGVGKTALMSVCRFLLAAEKRHSMKSCRNVSFEFSKDGPEIFHRYTLGSFHQDKFEPKTYCFDDLGLERDVNFYGTQSSVMAEIILSRYDLYHSFGMITHITTNLNSEDMEARYGPRIRSRCREMFNLISYPSTTPDKRK